MRGILSVRTAVIFDGINETKGTTAVEARVSAMMEAIERYSTEVRNMKFLMDRYSELNETENVLNPKELIIPDYVKNVEEVRIREILHLMDKFSDADVSLLIRDIKSEIGVPTFAAVSDDTLLRDPALLTIGMGTHTDLQSRCTIQREIMKGC